MITCTCPKCVAVVGEFEYYDDHGAVIVKCPSCETKLEVHNALLDMADPENDGDGTLVLQEF